MFSHELRTSENGTAILALSGELDTYAAQALDSYLEQLVPGLAAPLRIDLSRLAYLNSSGLRCFLRLDKLLKAKGNSFSLEGLKPNVMRVFEYGSLDTYFQFVEPTDLKA